MTVFESIETFVDLCFSNNVQIFEKASGKINNKGNRVSDTESFLQIFVLKRGNANGQALSQ